MADATWNTTWNTRKRRRNLDGIAQPDYFPPQKLNRWDCTPRSSTEAASAVMINGTANSTTFKDSQYDGIFVEETEFADIFSFFLPVDPIVTDSEMITTQPIPVDDGIFSFAPDDDDSDLTASALASAVMTNAVADSSLKLPSQYDALTVNDGIIIFASDSDDDDSDMTASAVKTNGAADSSLKLDSQHDALTVDDGIFSSTPDDNDADMTEVHVLSDPDAPANPAPFPCKP